MNLVFKLVALHHKMIMHVYSIFLCLSLFSLLLLTGVCTVFLGSEG